jgi:hypothetical protein
MTPYIRVGGYKRFGGTCYLHLHGRRQQHSRLHCIVTQNVTVKIFPFVKTSNRKRLAKWRWLGQYSHLLCTRAGFDSRYKNSALCLVKIRISPKSCPICTMDCFSGASKRLELETDHVHPSVGRLTMRLYLEHYWRHEHPIWWWWYITAEGHLSFAWHETKGSVSRLQHYTRKLPIAHIGC